MHIFPVNCNHGPHQYDVRSPQGNPTVNKLHKDSSPALGKLIRAGRALFLLVLLASSMAAFAQQANTIAEIRVIGQRRIPKETILARMFTHQGDQYDPVTVERDFNSLWNTGYFANLRIEREDTEKGVILDVYVTEKPTIEEINYHGLNSFSVSDALDRFKKEKVGLTQESQFDPTRIKHAEAVLREMEAEHGHQFATIKTEVKTIPPAMVQVNFSIKEGPTVKVGDIRFTGNKHISPLILRRAMKNLKPVGIPYSLIFENLFAKTFDSSKLEEDTERVREAYRDKGYANAAVEEPQTKIRDEGGLNWFTFRPRHGKRIDILLPIEEGARYRLGTITFTGNKAIVNPRFLRAQFNIKDGEWYDNQALAKGMDNLKKAYGGLGYINFAAIPKPAFDDQKHVVSWVIDIDEGKQFYVSRIEFQGNTTTRDKVIRRELLLEEGQVYNSQLWEYSVLRLNQLEYFEPLRVDQDSEAHQDPETGTVDLLLKVREKGKNSIGLNGGVSGLSGAFLGVNYQTNNFLGLGETLSLQGNLGSVGRTFTFGFSQPYVHNRPLNMGFQIFDQKQDFNASKAYQASTGQSVNLSAAQQSLTQNYNQASRGLTFSVSYPLRRHNFQRLGFTYSFNDSNITAFSTASQTFFQTIAFRSGIQGSNALTGIINSSASFSYIYNTVNNPLRPRTGKEYTAVLQFSGIGGNLRYIAPFVAYKSYRSMHYFRPDPTGHNVLALRAQLGYIQGFGGDVAPPNSRFYAGGEQEIRGFDIRGATPYGYVPNRTTVQLTNPDGSCVPRDPTNPQLNQCIQVPIPVYGIASIGGDTNLTANAEYRIPIAGPVTWSFFDDFGVDGALNKGQLEQSPEGFATLTAPLYGCAVYNNGACQGGIPGSEVGFQRNIRTVAGTNFVPRMSLGGELSVIMPVINAPFRLYFAYNPLRLYETPYCNENANGSRNQSCSAQLITRDMFPPGGAGDYTYGEAIQGYGALNEFREPRKTFRLAVSTTF